MLGYLKTEDRKTESDAKSIKKNTLKIRPATAEPVNHKTQEISDKNKPQKQTSKKPKIKKNTPEKKIKPRSKTSNKTVNKNTPEDLPEPGQSQKCKTLKHKRQKKQKNQKSVISSRKIIKKSTQTGEKAKVVLAADSPISKEETKIFHTEAKTKGETALNEWKPNTHIRQLPTVLGRFLGGYERNQYAMVLRGEKGAGKTRFLCQSINLFANEGLKCLFKSLEVSTQSELLSTYTEYIEEKNKSNVFVDDNNSLQVLESQCKKYDCIAIDSWSKLKGLAYDQSDFERLLKKYPNVVWLVIFQSTTAGSAKGGLSSEYDGSNVIQIKKGGNAEFEKNRYGACDKVYNVFSKKMM